MQYQNARTSLASIDNYMKLPIERPAEAEFLHRPVFHGALEFRDVTFAYPGSSQPALKKVSFKIKPGEKVGIIGRIGSGKTTLEKLALALYKPTEGAVLLDGVDVRQIDPADVRRAIGHVPQDPLLFYGSLKHNNLAMGAPYADDASILAAANLAGVSEFANLHPNGFDMLIGERGESLSGGQRQSVAVARALINDPPILLLDEPSSNMDQSEAQLRKRLGEVSASKTIMLVTHRTALLELVDRLIVIDNGQIMADGPKEQVIEALRQDASDAEAEGLMENIATQNPPPGRAADAALAQAAQRLRVRLRPPARRRRKGKPQQRNDYVGNAEWVIHESQARGARVLLWTSLLAVALLLLWAGFGSIDEVVRGEAGRALAPGADHPEPGRRHRRGNPGETRPGGRGRPDPAQDRLHPLRLLAGREQRRVPVAAGQVGAPEGAGDRRALRRARGVLKQAPNLIEMERNAWQARTSELNATVNVAREQLKQRQEELRETIAKRDQASASCGLTSRELQVTRPLLKSGAVSEVDLLRLQRDVARYCGEQKGAEAQIDRIQASIKEAQSKLEESELNIRNQARNELSETNTKLSTLREGKLALADRVKLAEVRAPVRGTVKTLFNNTVGGVVQPGKDIIEIVPRTTRCCWKCASCRATSVSCMPTRRPR